MKLTAYDLGAKPSPAEIVSQSASVKRVKSAYEFVRPRGGQPNPNSPAQKCKRAGLNRDAIGAYRRRNPDCPRSDEEVIAYLLDRRSRGGIDKLAKAHGLSPSTVKTRIYRGKTLEEALSEPVPHTRRRAKA